MLKDPVAFPDMYSSFTNRMKNSFQTVIRNEVQHSAAARAGARGVHAIRKEFRFVNC
jgi:hypothetical protein